MSYKLSEKTQLS